MNAHGQRPQARQGTLETMGIRPPAGAVPAGRGSRRKKPRQAQGRSWPVRPVRCPGQARPATANMRRGKCRIGCNLLRKRVWNHCLRQGICYREYHGVRGDVHGRWRVPHGPRRAAPAARRGRDRTRSWSWPNPCKPAARGRGKSAAMYRAVCAWTEINTRIDRVKSPGALQGNRLGPAIFFQSRCLSGRKAGCLEN